MGVSIHYHEPFRHFPSHQFRSLIAKSDRQPYKRRVPDRALYFESPTGQLSLYALVGLGIEDVDCILANPKVEPFADGGFQLFLE